MKSEMVSDLRSYSLVNSNHVQCWVRRLAQHKMHLYKPVRKGQESSVYTVFSNQQDQKTKKFQVETAPAPYIESKHYFIHISKEKGLKIVQRLNYATIMYKMTWPVRPVSTYTILFIWVKKKG